jgi:hypothetical protein
MVMRFFNSQQDKRDSAVLIPKELILIPSTEPYTIRLAEKPVQSSGVKIIRYGWTERLWWASGRNDDDVVGWGWNTEFVQRTYVIYIDTAGEIGEGVTFKWSRDGGVSWAATLVPVPSEWPILLENGVHVKFKKEYAGPPFAVSDKWGFTIYPWVEEAGYFPSAASKFVVNYQTGDVTFHEDDAGKLVRAYYYGLGSLCDVKDINDLINWVKDGRQIWGGINTSMFNWGEHVGFDWQKAAPRQLERARTRPPVIRSIGMVIKVDDDDGMILLRGIAEPVEEGWDIFPQGEIWMGDESPGLMWWPPDPSYKGRMRQRLGIGLETDKFFLNIEPPEIIGEQDVKPTGIESTEAWGTPTVTVG